MAGAPSSSSPRVTWSVGICPENRIGAELSPLAAPSALRDDRWPEEESGRRPGDVEAECTHRLGAALTVPSAAELRSAADHGDRAAQRPPLHHPGRLPAPRRVD